MRKVYLQNVQAGVVAVNEEEFEKWPDAKKKDFEKIEPVFLRHKIDRREVVISKEEFSKWGDNEKADWDELKDPEERSKSILDAAFAAGTTSKKAAPKTGGDAGSESSGPGTKKAGEK